MARLIRPLRRTLLSPPKTLIPSLVLHNKVESNPFVLSPTQITFARGYISEMRKSALQENILRLLRYEIQYELERPPPAQPTNFNSFAIDDQPGEPWIRLTRKFNGNNEEIKVEATMFDGATPIPKPGSDDDVRLHLTLIVNVSKGGGDALEVLCSVWPDSLEISKLFIRSSGKSPAKPYVGPEFKDLDDKLQDSLYEFLEARGIDDQMAVFLHKYMMNKDKIELLKWLGTVKSYVEKK